MKRIEIILEKLKEMMAEFSDGVSAIQISEALDLNRANVSNDLNKLAAEGKAVKIKGKPTLFKYDYKENVKLKKSVLDSFSQLNPSLYSAVEQAKAAVLYPPTGMNMLILGETGVGKSTFASLVYKYAVEVNVKNEKSPFITFNCADYANNPQLLLGQIFGVKKGAYTGAEQDKIGLIEKADGGILFLDEVHRLPAEGQEMFFTFIDKGVYRRLGETESERSARVLIITATTEDPDASLLKTFTRRIPMVINIPPLRERNMEERFNLIKGFMLDESSRLKKAIKLSVNSIKAFLSYDCTANVGQLKSDVQLACAKAYADFLSKKNNEIIISSLDLPPYIREGLYKETEHRQLWNKLIDINKRFCIFDANEDNLFFDENTVDENIYELIDRRTRELKCKGLKGIELEQEIEDDIDDYFSKYINKENTKIDVTNIRNIIEPSIMRIIEEMIVFYEEELNIKINKKIYYGLAVHINNSIDRIKRHKKIINPRLNSIRKEHAREFNAALESLKIIERAIDVSIPIDEAGFITMFLVYNDKNDKKLKNKVLVMIIAHGVSTATSMADAVNNLLGCRNVVGINAPIEERPKSVLEKTKEYIRANSINSNILFLVDMGSLTTFGREIEKEFNLKTRTVPLVSTLHAVEAARKSMMNYPLDEVYRQTLEVNNLYDNNILDYEPQEEEKKLAIITVCTTGEGGAKTVKMLLEKKIDFDEDLIKIVPLNFIGKENIYERIEKLENKYEILCFVGPFELDVDYKQFMLDDIMSGSCLYEIQKIVEDEKTYYKMGESLDSRLKHLDGKMILKDIKKFNKTVEESCRIKINNSIFIGITLHMACMIDKIMDNEEIEEFHHKDMFIEKNKELYKSVKNACTPINTKYSIIIPDDELCRIMTFFKENN